MIYCEVLLSTSPRGRELKSDTGGKAQRRPQSTSPRGRELKMYLDLLLHAREGRPPREVVS